MTLRVHPWTHQEVGWDADRAAQSESLLALSNGYLGVRGSLEEGLPGALPATYLSGFFESIPIPYAERGAGDPEFDQVLVSLPDGMRIRLFVDGDPLDIRTGRVERHERTLDLRTGLLTRALDWSAPSGARIRLRSRRLVSLAHREIAAIEYEFEAVGRPVQVVVHSELGLAPVARRPSADPRAGALLPEQALVPRLSDARGPRAVLVHETLTSRNVVAAGMHHSVAAMPSGLDSADTGVAEGARWAITGRLGPGLPLRFVKLLSYHWAPGGDPVQLAREVDRSLDVAGPLGFEGLAALQRAALDDVWHHADIELDGDPEVQHALRYALFQLHQNAAFAAGRAIPAKGLTGPGYNGHTFWDTEAFLLPALTHCAPRHAEDALRWRASTLPQARDKARRLGLGGAAFPWRTISGEECSGYMPAGIAAFHVNAAIAHAVGRHLAIGPEAAFEHEVAAPLLVETARMWVTLGYHDERRNGRFSIDGVTGPDEYSTLVDNNLYTNLMAQANLRAAAALVERLGHDTTGAGAEEVTAWRRAADAMTVPHDGELGIHLQDEDFTRHAAFDFDGTPPQSYPLLLHVPYFELYRKQVVKQPDLVLAMALCGDAFTEEDKRRNFTYYEAITVRDSSLSAGTQAILAAEVGDLQLAYDYLAEAVLLDHEDSAHNTADGLHLAALAGGWYAVIAGLAGMRERDGRLCFAPRLPSGIDRIAFTLRAGGGRLGVQITQTEATYTSSRGDDLSVEHWGTTVVIPATTAVTQPISPPARRPPVIRQPPGRSPRRRVRLS